MKILFATDGSEYSEGAAKLLTCFDLTHEDEIMVIHAISWVPFKYDMESYYESLKEIKKEIAPGILDSALEILAPVPAKISTAIIDGSPEKYIVQAAAQAEMDMVVMGARGIKGIKSLLVGSVTKSVAINSPVPVYIVKLPACRPGQRMKILFATDGSEHSAQVGRYLASLPLYADTEIVILHVIWSDFSDIPERFVAEINDRIKEFVAESRTLEFRESALILEQASKLVGDKYGNIKTVSKVGDPSLEIIRTAHELDVDAVAIGCRGLRGIKGVMGSVSRNVLNHAHCSVLLSKSCEG